jgi:hypothetical protein
MNRRVLRWATTSARIVVGTAVAAAGVIAVTVAIAAPWPTLSTEPVRVEATPAPSDAVLACDGPLLALGRLVEQAGQISVAASQTIVSGPADAAAEESVLIADGGALPVALSAAPTDRQRALLAASGSASVEAPDLRGFAASACRPPLLESWLVGGATTTGTGDVVVLANPGDVAATVELTVYGASGPVVAPGGSNRVVPAGAQIVIPLAGLVTGEESPVVRVTSTGAPVAAALQSSIIRVLDPGGIDQFGAVATASEHQVIAGVPVTAPEGATGAATVATLVRMLSPAAETEARVTVLAADGSVAASEVVVPLAAGVPSELDLGALPVGRYTIQVDAGGPVVAGAWTATGFAAGSDFAWIAAAPEITTPTAFAVPAGPAPVLTLVNNGAEAVTVTLSSGEGAELTVAPGAVLERAVTPSTVYTLDPSGAVSASVTFAGPGAVAGFPVWGADAAAQPVVVYP